MPDFVTAFTLRTAGAALRRIEPAGHEIGNLAIALTAEARLAVTGLRDELGHLLAIEVSRSLATIPQTWRELAAADRIGLAAR